MYAKDLKLLLSETDEDSEIVISCEGDTIREREDIKVFVENGDIIIMID